MRRRYVLIVALAFVITCAMPLMLAFAQENVTVTVAVVNNPDQRKLLELSDSSRRSIPTSSCRS